MNERGPRGYNPNEIKREQNSSEGLTSQGINPYAINGGKFMPEGTNGGADNPRPTERPWDPIDTALNSNGPEQRRQLLNDARQLADQDSRPPSPDDPEYEAAKARNIDLQDDQVREVERQSVFTDVNNLDVLSLPDVRALSKRIAQLRPTNLFNEDEMNRLSSLVAERHAHLELEEDAREELAREGYLNPPQELIDQMIERKRPQKKPSTIIQNLRSQILNSENPNAQERVEDMRDNFIYLKRYVKTVLDSAVGPDKTLKLQDATEQRLRDIIDKDPEQLSEEEIKETTRWLTDVGEGAFNMQQYFIFIPSERRGGKRGLVQSLEDLAELIIEAQDHRFAPGQKFEIINKRGEIVKENFISWIRSSIVSLHEANPDKVINPFSDISIPTSWRNINFNEMVSTPAYFQKRKMVISGEEGRGGQVEYINTADNEYNHLKDTMLMEAWMFGESHSDDATFRQVMGRESDLFGAINKMYEYNVFTKNDRFQEFVLRFARTDLKGSESELQRFLENGEQGSVGKAIRRSLVSYYYLSELAFSDKIPPEENPFYKAMGKDGMKYFWQSISETMLSKSFSTEISDTMQNFRPGDEEEDLTEIQRVLRNPDRHAVLSQQIKGKYGITEELLTQYQDDPEKLALTLMGNIHGWKKSNLNIFDNVKKDKKIIDMMFIAMAEASGRVNNLSKTDTDYAGLWVQSMINWTGISARNDTGAIGFNAWSKMQNFGPYRLRQGSGRSGPGNMYSMPGLKRLSLTLFDGLQVTEDYDKATGKSPKKTFMEALQGGRGNNINLDDELSHFHFENNAQSQFAATHINNAKSMMDFVLDKMEYKLRDLFKKDPATGMLIFNHEAGHKIMDEYWKNIRYALDQPGFLYDDEIWGWEQVVKYGKDGKPVKKDDGTIERELVFGKKKIRDHMFNKEITQLDMYHSKDHKLPESKIARNVFAYLISKEILAHRKWDSGYDRWSISDIQAVQAFFEHFPDEILVGEDTEDGDLVKVEMVKSFFNHHEWKDILGLIKSSYGKMWTLEGLAQLSAALIGGTAEMAKDTLKQSTKLAS